ncbi:MAG: hypothetical protein HYS13_22375 [Planctomycetia bacterium]|nr:hypothetical protein [Planctomycetia bacterium]
MPTVSSAVCNSGAALDAQTLLTWAQVVVSGAITLIVIPLGFYFARFYWERRRWRAYERLIRNWARDEFFGEKMNEDDWHALAATKLTEAGFEPTKIDDLMQTAVWFAKGKVSQEQRGRIPSGEKENRDGERDKPK